MVGIDRGIEGKRRGCEQKRQPRSSASEGQKKRPDASEANATSLVGVMRCVMWEGFFSEIHGTIISPACSMEDEKGPSENRRAVYAACNQARVGGGGEEFWLQRGERRRSQP